MNAAYESPRERSARLREQSLDLLASARRLRLRSQQLLTLRDDLRGRLGGVRGPGDLLCALRLRRNGAEPGGGGPGREPPG